MEKPFVVSREQIGTSGAERGLTVRSFLDHELLSRARSPGTELSWVEARSGQDVTLRAHSLPTLLIIMRGRARLVGTTTRDIEQGDVVTLPGDAVYGFAAVEGDLHVLLVTLRSEANSEDEEEGLTFERLMRQNRRRVDHALETPFFRLLRRGSLDPRKRAVAGEVIRVFSDAFQTFLFTRQSMCRDERYLATFHGHLLEELGHNSLLKVSGNKRILGDPILRATSSWFCHQMIILDNAGKAVVNLALETGGYHFHSLAKPVFADEDSARYFDVHAEEDEHHMDMGLELLQGLHPDTYRRLLRVLDDSWDMIETMTTRFVELIEIEANSS